MLNKTALVNRWTIGLTLAVVIVLFLLSYNAYFWTDDLIDRLIMSRLGQINVPWSQYMLWDGRGFSPIVILRNIILCNATPEISAIITTLFFLITCSLLTKALFNHLLLIEIKGEEWLVVAIIFAICLWMGMRPHLSRSFYWTTGSFYSNVNLLVGLWLFYLSSTNKKTWIIVLLSLFLTLSGVNIAAGVLTLYTCAILLKLIPFDFKQQVPVMIALLVGTVATTFAPGNFARASEGGKQLSFELQDLAVGYYQVLIEYLLMSKWIIIGSLLFVLSFQSLFRELKVARNKKIRWSLVFLASALATIVPFTPIPDAASKHTAIYFQTFLLLSSISFLSYFCVRFEIPQFIQRLTIFSITVYFLVLGLNQYKLGRTVKAQVLARYDLLESKRGSSDLIVLDSIKLPDELYTTRSWEISTDTAAWENKALREYFGTGPVMVKK